MKSLDLLCIVTRGRPLAMFSRALEVAGVSHTTIVLPSGLIQLYPRPDPCCEARHPTVPQDTRLNIEHFIQLLWYIIIIYKIINVNPETL